MWSQLYLFIRILQYLRLFKITFHMFVFSQEFLVEGNQPSLYNLFKMVKLFVQVIKMLDEIFEDIFWQVHYSKSKDSIP